MKQLNEKLNEAQKKELLEALFAAFDKAQQLEIDC
jgi:hypothetical protein